ncbi:MAG: hypothetical protein Q4E75_04850 [bacterium]|nr:hypothetical protein [bacterium]
MELKGKGYLNKNAYKNIRVNLCDNNYSVIVSSNGVKLENYLNYSEKFTDQIKELSDEEQIYEIVNRFLMYSKINNVTEASYYYKDKFRRYVKVSGEYRNLFLQLKNSEISKKIISNIIKKYNFDRDNFVYDILDREDIVIIKIGNATSKMSYLLNGTSFLNINLNSVNKLDQKFLETLLENELENNNYMYNKISYYRKKDDSNTSKPLYQDYEIHFNINNHRYSILGFNNCKIVNEVLKKYNNKDFYNFDSYQLKLDMWRD